MCQVKVPFLLTVLVYCAESAVGVGNSDLSQRTTQSQRVDLIELNHRYDDQGRHCYDQIIFYEWSPDYRRYHVVSWCLVDSAQSRLPYLNRDNQHYEVTWYDREANCRRKIWAPIFRETWSSRDPERDNKELMDEKYRVSLLRQPARISVR